MEPKISQRHYVTSRNDSVSLKIHLGNRQHVRCGPCFCLQTPGFKGIPEQRVYGVLSLSYKLLGWEGVRKANMERRAELHELLVNKRKVFLERV